jgi:hypothetical protein
LVKFKVPRARRCGRGPWGRAAMEAPGPCDSCTVSCDNFTGGDRVVRTLVDGLREVPLTKW